MWGPLYPTGALKLDVGAIVGAHKIADIANMIQRKLAVEMQDVMLVM
jgi:hypothetical protein